MSSGAWMMGLATIIAIAALLFLVGSMIRSIQDHRTPGKSVWREFGLGLSLMLLFFATWFAHGVTEYQAYSEQQKEHNQPVEVGGFFVEFSQSTLENWQSEFLQLFAFVVLAALYIHKGSAESKDSDEKVEAALQRIEERLGTWPAEPAPPQARTSAGVTLRPD